MEKDNISRRIIPNLVMLVFFGALFLAGTFFDETIAGTIFSPGNTVAAVVTSTGVLPFFAAPMLFIGALYERAIHSGKSKSVKIVLCTVCVILAAFVGVVGAGAVTDHNCLGYIFPSLHRNIPVIIIVSIIFEYPLFFVGYHFAKKSDDKLLVKKIIVLLIILLAAFLCMRLLKNVFNRPRYRTVVLGYEGVGFVPWYELFSGAGEFSLKYGISLDEFFSFPSGHSIISVSAVYIFPSVSWLFPKLEKRCQLLIWAGFLFGIMIMLTRMILGAHYLSDVSAGAIIGVLLSLAFTVIQSRIASARKI